MGRPKEWLPIAGEPMLLHVVHRVAARSPIVVVSAAEAQPLPPLPHSVEVVRDPVADRGPLQGLATGLEALIDRVEWAYVTASDAPFLQPRWIDRLLEFSEDVELVMPHVEGRDHPLSALYRPGPACVAAATLLRADRLRLGSLRDLLRTRVIPADVLNEVDPEFDTLRNANDPAEYRSILDRIAGDGPSSIR
jgi:molybdopterin-guanine dinucleotide biosynthesis protein A